VITHASVAKAGQKAKCNAFIKKQLKSNGFELNADHVTAEIDNFTDYTDDDDCKAYNALLILLFALANAQWFQEAGDYKSNYKRLISDDIFDEVENSSNGNDSDKDQ